MLLSDSEAFWLAMVYEELSDLHYVNVSPQTTVKDAAEGDTSRSQAQGFGVYKLIRELAVTFGLGRAAELVVVHDEKPITPPDGVIWAAGNGDALSPENYQAIRTTIAEEFRVIRDTVEGSPGFANYAEAFVRRSRNVLAGYITGYAPSTPGVVYHISTQGEPCVLGYVDRRSPGLYLTLLGLFGRYLPLPPLERMAMAGAGFQDDTLGRPYCPVLADIEKPLGAFDPKGFMRVLEDFRESNSNRPGWGIGQEMTLLLTMARQAAEGMSDTASRLDAYESDEMRVGAQHSVGTSADPSEKALDGEEACEASHTEEEWDSPGEAVGALLAHVREQMHALAQTLCRADDEEAASMQESLERIYYETDHFRQTADAVAASCRDAGLAAVAEMVLAARDAAPHIQWHNPLHVVFHDFTAAFADKLAGSFDKAVKTLSDARKLAYGELRLRELKWDEHGLPAPALTGWARQNENIRAAIKVAIEQLNNGLPPYVVLSQLAPAPESLVRQLAAKHLTTFHGISPGALLKELRATIGTGPDDHCERVTLAIAQSLVSLRNWVIHEPDAEWSRDHAIFFLNGLSLLLREV